MTLIRILLLLGLAALLSAAQAQTEKWPARPVRIVVTFPPGGVTDVVARLLGAGMTKEFGQQFIVDNMPGAGGTIGIEYVVNAKPDGYTTIVVPSSFAIVPSLYKNLSYDPIKGIAPISMIVAGHFVLVVNPTVKANNLKELLDLARANPGSLNFGSAGLGTDLHLSLELFQQLARIQLVHVPYKGFVPALSDLLGGQIQMMLSTPLSVAPHLKSGKLRAIGVTTEQRTPAMPGIPAINEQVPGYAVKAWWGMGATAGTPREIVMRLNQAVAQVLNQPEAQERLRAAVGVEPAHSTPEELARLINEDFATWAKVIKSGSVKIE